MQILEKINLKPKTIYLKDYTTFKIGGLCRYFYEPTSTKELKELWDCIIKNKLDYFIIGAGSNILASDEEIQKIIISLSCFNEIEVENTLVRAQAGAMINDLNQKALEEGLSGFEFMNGLPATLGGALFMNARCFGGEINEALQSVDFLNEKGELETYIKDSKDFSYKISPFQKRKILIFSATFLLKRENQKNILSKMILNLEKRKEKGHYKSPSAGSFFKNDYNLGIPAGVLIEEVGLKGAKKGKAQIAPWHANFIINNGGAKMKDILKLSNEVKLQVKNQKGILLEEEVILLK